MSKRRLRKCVLFCFLWLSFYAGVYACVKWHSVYPWALILENLIPIGLGIPAVFLSAALNRRNSHLEAMRDLWKHVIPAAQAAIQYTHLNSPKQEDFARIQESLSTAIDSLRGVYSNVNAPTSQVGLYPYENLKDIHKIVSWLGYGPNFRDGDAPQARKCITRLWQEMHASMLTEFDRDVPLTPVSKYLRGNKSIADLLIEGDLTAEDTSIGRKASDPRGIARHSP